MNATQDVNYASPFLATGLELSMSSIIVFFGIITTIAIGAISPGPSFVLVSRIAVSRSRREAVAAAIGMGAGGVTFAMLALIGLTALLMQVGWLYLSLKIAGGLYLLYLAYRIWRGAGEAIGTEAPEIRSGSMVGHYVWFGLATQLSNPKAAVVYASIFAALLPAAPEKWLFLAIPPAIFCIEAGWYCVVAVVFSSQRPRALYLRSKRWIDRAAGTVMGGLGLRLITDGLRRHV
jgi:threonine/homoserine/homoserine lactone efflux protein